MAYSGIQTYTRLQQEISTRAKISSKIKADLIWRHEMKTTLFLILFFSFSQFAGAYVDGDFHLSEEDISVIVEEVEKGNGDLISTQLTSDEVEMLDELVRLGEIHKYSTSFDDQQTYQVAGGCRCAGGGLFSGCWTSPLHLCAGNWYRGCYVKCK